MTSTALDIIIPVYNGAGSIAGTLRALFAQKIDPPARLQIIISDDGSTDATAATIEQLRPESPWPLQVVRGEHRGVATARNRALAASSASLLFLLGADIILRPGALATHLAWHQQHSDITHAALGYVAWDPRLPPTPFMAWMAHGGPQNNFDALLGEQAADPRHYFYGSHLSLKRVVLAGEGWQEAFTTYGWEDIELGRRLVAHGLRLKPLFAAQGLHHHYYSTRDISRRQRAAGATLVVYQQLYPALPLVPPATWRSFLKVYFLQWSGLLLALRLVLAYSGKRWSTPRLFSLVSSVEYRLGILMAQRR